MKAVIFVAACLCGTVMHFLYEPLGRPALLRPLLPASESPWEHFKLAFWPLCTGLILQGLLQGRPCAAVLCACFLAAFHAFCTMMGIYYLYRAAFGVKKPVLWADIGNFFLTMTLGWRLGLRMLDGSFGSLQAVFAGVGLALCAALFLLTGGEPPDLPLFREDRG